MKETKETTHSIIPTIKHSGDFNTKDKKDQRYQGGGRRRIGRTQRNFR